MPKQLTEMMNLIETFKYAFSEELASYDPENGDTEKNANDISSITLDELEEWVENEMETWKD